MRAVREFVANLPSADRLQIMTDYAVFERDGFIGDCVLRRRGSEIADQLDAGGNIVRWMEQVANMTFRFYAERHLLASGLGQLDEL